MSTYPLNLKRTHLLVTLGLVYITGTKPGCSHDMIQDRTPNKSCARTEEDYSALDIWNYGWPAGRRQPSDHLLES